MDILQIGHPQLRESAAPFVTLPTADAVESGKHLSQALDDFRAQHGFGRAVAGPQIGISRRMIALAMTGWPRLMLNPEITWRSDDDITLWDDCMCFPFLLVKVVRSRSISVRFQDIDGALHEREHIDTATSELLQHEIDHLDGVLAVDHAVDRDSLVSRETFEADVPYYLQQVSYRGVWA